MYACCWFKFMGHAPWCRHHPDNRRKGDDLIAGNLVRREDGAAQERAKVVAWLRKRGDCWSTDDEIADAIEAGAHEGDPQ